MVGSYVFRPDGYFICCNIYPHISPFLKKSPGTLRDSLISRKTKFIVLDRVGKAFWHPSPDDLTFVLTHYLESAYRKIYTLGVWFWCDGGACIRKNTHGQDAETAVSGTLDIPIAETFAVATQPAGAWVELNGRRFTDGERVSLASGIYRFSVPPDILEFKIQMDR